MPPNSKTKKEETGKMPSLTDSQLVMEPPSPTVVNRKLTSIHDRIRSGAVDQGMVELFRTLRKWRASPPSGTWKEVVTEHCLKHPVSDVIYEDWRAGGVLRTFDLNALLNIPAQRVDVQIGGAGGLPGALQAAQNVAFADPSLRQRRRRAEQQGKSRTDELFTKIRHQFDLPNIEMISIPEPVNAGRPPDRQSYRQPASVIA